MFSATYPLSFLPVVELTPAAAKAIVLVWLFALGGAIGSFLNVVIYRLPAGKSLVHPGSHCPACGHPIRWHDNVPIFAWIWLGGRCRDCSAPISVRYPIIEAITAGLFVAVGAVEGLSDGANLPLARGVLDGGVDVLPIEIGELACMVAYHLFLLSTLLAAAMIEFDGHRPPGRMLVFALGIAWLMPVIGPFLHPVPAWGGEGGPAGGVIGASVGLIPGLLLGLGVWFRRGSDASIGRLMGLALVGVCLGWQAAGVLMIVAGLLGRVCWMLEAWLPGMRRLGFTLWLAVGSLAWILAWGEIVERWALPCRGLWM